MNPAIFSRVLAASKPDPLKAYAAIYEGFADDYLTTIEEAQLFAQGLNYEAAMQNLAFSPLQIVAIERKQATAAAIIPVDELIAAGFPKDKPVHLHFQRKNGEKHLAAALIRKYFNQGAKAVFTEVIQ